MRRVSWPRMEPVSVRDLNDRLSGFDRLLGVEYVEVTDEVVRARVPLSEDLKQPAGLAHGGLFASLAESIASVGTAVQVYAEGNTAVGLSNATSFVRPITEGSVHGVARRRHRGRTTWIWDVEIRDDAGRTCALTRMTIAVRPARP